MGFVKEDMCHRMVDHRVHIYIYIKYHIVLLPQVFAASDTVPTDGI